MGKKAVTDVQQGKLVEALPELDKLTSGLADEVRLGRNDLTADAEKMASIRKTVALGNVLLPEQIDDLKRMVSDLRSRLASALPPAHRAGDKDTSPEQLTALATSHGKDKLVVIALLNNKNTPAEALAKLLAENTHPDVRRAIGGHVNASEEIKTVVAQDRNASFAPVEPRSLPQVKVGPLITRERFGDEEQQLRTTIFKSSAETNTILASATSKGRELVRNANDDGALATRLRYTPADQIKNEIARSIGALREDGKYGDSSGYSDLSTNKKALVDAIYKGMIAAALPPKGGLEVPEGREAQQIPNPGVRARIAEGFTADGVTFAKGDPCILIEKEGQQYVQKVTWTGTKYAVDDKLVKLDRADQITGVGSLEGNRWREQTFVRTDAPLFEGPISPKDLKQGNYGDCYVIASIQTIAHRFPDAIHEMIKDNGDTVTVRLYDKADPPTYEMTDDAFANLKARQAELKLTDEQVAVLGTRGTRTASQLNDTLADTSGLTAAKAALELFEANNKKPEFKNEKKVKDARDAYDKQANELKAVVQQCAVRQEQLLTAMSDVSEVLAPKYITFEKSTLSTSMVSAQHATGALWGQMLEKAYAIHLGSYEAMGGGGSDANVSRMSNVFEAMTGRKSDRVNLWNATGRLEGGDHEENAPIKREKVFRDVTRALEQGKLVGAATEANIGKSQGSGHSGGESIVDGLAGGHAYGVLETVEMNGRQFVKVANPWGTAFARAYTMDENGQLVSKKFDKSDYSYLPDSPTKQGAGTEVNESWLSWEDFCDQFKDLHVSSY